MYKSLPSYPNGSFCLLLSLFEPKWTSQHSVASWNHSISAAHRHLHQQPLSFPPPFVLLVQDHGLDGCPSAQQPQGCCKPKSGATNRKRKKWKVNYQHLQVGVPSLNPKGWWSKTPCNRYHLAARRQKKVLVHSLKTNRSQLPWNPQRKKNSCNKIHFQLRAVSFGDHILPLSPPPKKANDPWTFPPPRNVCYFSSTRRQL